MKNIITKNEFKNLDENGLEYIPLYIYLSKCDRYRKKIIKLEKEIEKLDKQIAKLDKENF